MTKVIFSKSENPTKRLKAIFYNDENKKIRTIHFGLKNPTGKGTFIDHKNDVIKKAWEARHSVRGTFNKPMSASALSKWILWNKPTLAASISDFKTRFGLK